MDRSLTKSVCREDGKFVCNQHQLHDNVLSNPDFTPSSARLKMDLDKEDVLKFLYL